MQKERQQQKPNEFVLDFEALGMQQQAPPPEVHMDESHDFSNPFDPLNPMPDELMGSQVQVFTQPLDLNAIELEEVIPTHEGMQRLGQINQAAANQDPNDFDVLDRTLVGKAFRMRIIQKPQSATGADAIRYGAGVIISSMSVILYVDPTMHYAAGRPVMQAVLVTGAVGANFSVTFFFVDDIFSVDKLPEEIVDEIMQNEETRDKIITRLVKGLGKYAVGTIASVPFIAVAKWPGHCASTAGQYAGDIFAIGSTCISMTLLNKYAVFSRMGNDIGWLRGKCTKDTSKKAYAKLMEAYSKTMHYYAKQIAMQPDLLDGLDFESELSAGRMIARMIEFAEDNRLELPVRTVAERVALWGCGIGAAGFTEVGLVGYGLATLSAVKKVIPVVGLSHLLAIAFGGPYGYMAGMAGAATGMGLLKLGIDLGKKCAGRGQFNLPLAFMFAPGWSVAGAGLMLGFSSFSYATTASLAIKFGMPTAVVNISKVVTLVINNYFASQVGLGFAEKIAANKYYVDGFSCCGKVAKCGQCQCCGKEVNCGGSKEIQKRAMFYRAIHTHLGDIAGFPKHYNLDYFEAIPANKRHWLFATLEPDEISDLISQARESEGLLANQRREGPPERIRMFAPGRQGNELNAQVEDELRHRGRLYQQEDPYAHRENIV